MSELTTADEITTPEDDDILPVRKAAIAGVLKMRLAQLKTYLLTDMSFLPAGGTTDQVLAKNSDADNDVSWKTVSGGGIGGVAEAPTDGKIYGRRNGTWVAIAGVYAIGDGHRYWRIRQHTSHDFNVSTLEMRATVGGDDQCTGGAGISSGKYSSSYIEAYAFDSNDTTFWASTGSGADHWLGYDFGSGVAVDVNQLLFRPGNSGGNPSDLILEYSDDSTTWTQKWSVGAVPTFASYLVSESGYSLP